MAKRQSDTGLRLLSLKPAGVGLSVPGQGQEKRPLVSTPQPHGKEGILQSHCPPPSHPEHHVVWKPSNQQEEEGRLAGWMIVQPSSSREISREDVQISTAPCNHALCSRALV